MSRFVRVLLTANLLLLTGCLTTYQSAGRNPFGHGFGQTQLKENLWNVYFQGGYDASAEWVQRALLYRCAEVARDAGYERFIVVDTNTSIQRSSRQLTPDRHEVDIVETPTGYRATGTTRRGMSAVHQASRMQATILGTHLPIDPEDPGAFEVEQTLRLLGPQVRGSR